MRHLRQTLTATTLVAAAVLALAGCRSGGADGAAGRQQPGVAATVPGEEVRLRGYGPVTASFGEDAVFACASPEKAAILYSKLRKDLTALGTTAPVAEGELWRFANGTFGAVGIAGNEVHAVGGADRQAVERRIAALGLRFPAASHPRYLDYYDHNAFRFYNKSVHLPGRWEFLKGLGAGGIGIQDPSVASSQAEGVLSFVEVDAVVRDAERNHGMVVLGPNVGGALPFWMQNKDPGKMARMQGSMLYSGWCSSVHAAAFEGDALWDGATSPIVAMQRLIAERYVASPALGGWHMNRGQPVGDMLGILMDGCMWDASADGKRAYVDFLKEKYTLSDLGRRWHGDAAKYRSWDEVLPVEVADLWGGAYEAERLLLNGERWSWRKSSKAEAGTAPAATGPWLAVTMPPSHRCTLLDSGSAYYRVQFRLPEGMRGKVQERLHLKMLVYMYDANQAYVWVNGQAVASAPVFASAVRQYGIALPPGSLRADGDNEIIIQTPDGRSDGRIHGPVSISAAPAENYPFRDARVNAQYLDAYEFKTAAAVRRITQMIRYARQFDPDRPMVLSDGSWTTLPRLMPMMKQYGVGHQYTACEGFYNPQYPGVAAQFDYYFSAEPTGSVLDEARLDRMMGLMFFSGASSYDMFFSLDQYMDFDRRTGALGRRKDLIRLVGKYLVEQPDTAIFWSSALPSSGESAWTWNLGRGEMQSAHVVPDYINEQGFSVGADARYRVIIDCGNEVLSEQAVSYLTAFVERGGTYVVLPPTGRSSPLQADARPVEALTGFRIAARGVRGKVRFAAAPSLFAPWAGMEFDGEGLAADYQKNAVTANSGLALEPAVPEAEAIATWAQGGVAIGVRPLGKGRVITLGSSFWRSGRDVNGKWLPAARNPVFEQLLAGLGCASTATASSERIWVRNAVAKNGLESWMVAANIAEDEPFAVTSDLSFRLGYAPATVVDRVTGQAVAFRVEADGRVVIPAVTFAKYQTRIFAAQRPGPLAGNLRTWWDEKRTHWHAAPQETLPLPEQLEPDALAIDRWRFQADRDGALAAAGAWQKSGFDDRGWQDIASGPWGGQAVAPAGYEGIGLYRRAFAIPKGWTGAVTLNFQSPAVLGAAEFFVNGRRIAANDAARVHPEFRGIESFDITAALAATGANVLAVQVKGAKGDGGICSALWIAHEKVLAPAVDLAGAWERVMGDQLTSGPATVPGVAKARFLRRTFDIPAEWKGRTIYLQLETPSIWCAGVMVNERFRTFHMENGPFGTRFEINITDLVRPGERNAIELWHRHTAPPNWRGVQWGWPKESDLSVSAIRVGCVAE